MSPLSWRPAFHSDSSHSDCHSSHLWDPACVFCETKNQNNHVLNDRAADEQNNDTMTIINAWSTTVNRDVLQNPRNWHKRSVEKWFLTYLISMFLNATKSQWSTFSTESGKRNKIYDWALTNIYWCTKKYIPWRYVGRKKVLCVCLCVAYIRNLFHRSKIIFFNCNWTLYGVPNMLLIKTECLYRWEICRHAASLSSTITTTKLPSATPQG